MSIFSLPFFESSVPCQASETATRAVRSEGGGSQSMRLQGRDDRRSIEPVFVHRSTLRYHDQGSKVIVAKDWVNVFFFFSNFIVHALGSCGIFVYMFTFVKFPNGAPKVVSAHTLYFISPRSNHFDLLLLRT